MMSLMRCGLVFVVLMLAACGAEPETPPAAGEIATLALESSAFAEGGAIPVLYTCDGQDLSPPLAWAEPPAGTESLALIVDDPDAPSGLWVHWVLFDIPAANRSLAEGVPGGEGILDLGVQGVNGWQRLGYGGPCPPQGPAHRYVFAVYALDTRLDLEPGASKGEVEAAMAGHVLAQGLLTGHYER